jgi:hypothetical protein
MAQVGRGAPSWERAGTGGSPTRHEWVRSGRGPAGAAGVEPDDAVDPTGSANVGRAQPRRRERTSGRALAFRQRSPAHRAGRTRLLEDQPRCRCSPSRAPTVDKARRRFNLAHCALLLFFVPSAASVDETRHGSPLPSPSSDVHSFGLRPPSNALVPRPACRPPRRAPPRQRSSVAPAQPRLLAPQLAAGGLGRSLLRPRQLPPSWSDRRPATAQRRSPPVAQSRRDPGRGRCRRGVPQWSRAFVRHPAGRGCHPDVARRARRLPREETRTWPPVTGRSRSATSTANSPTVAPATLAKTGRRASALLSTRRTGTRPRSSRRGETTTRRFRPITAARRIAPAPRRRGVRRKHGTLAEDG